MGGRGPAPKAGEDLRRRNREQAFETLPSAGNTKAYPPLPKTYRTGTVVTKDKAERQRTRVLRNTFLPETKAWYETWATSPQATKFTAVTWQRLRMLATVVDLYEREPSTKLLGEIRLQEASFGGTPLDLMRLRWSVAARAEERALAAVTPIADGGPRRFVPKSGG